ncbi:c-type cytochrome [Caldimonas tepidiphila]|uniref:c-type cytochrome n=1 Tax=Caldimonas tepidiphila TaxID=2315841 RepID=UPI001F0B9529|nr:c-type cytochrome [Caldimonas tepidiphila]
MKLKPLSWLALLALCAPAWGAGEAELGRNLAATCANCHGTDGRARPGMAPLAGMPADALVRALDEFRSGRRPATIMHQIARGYTDEQIRLIAAHFAAQAAAPAAPAARP